MMQTHMQNYRGARTCQWASGSAPGAPPTNHGMEAPSSRTASNSLRSPSRRSPITPRLVLLLRFGAIIVYHSGARGYFFILSYQPCTKIRHHLPPTYRARFRQLAFIPSSTQLELQSSSARRIPPYRYLDSRAYEEMSIRTHR